MCRPARTLLATLLVGLWLSGCGTIAATSDQAADSEPTSASITGTAQPWLTPEGDVLVTCSDEPAFPVSLISEGGLQLQPHEAEEVVNALAHLKDIGGIDAPAPLQTAEATQVKWTVLWWEGSGEQESVGLLVTSPEATGFSLDSDEIVLLDRQDEQLSPAGWSGTCGARPALPAGSEWAQMALPEEAANPTGTTVDLLVSEIQCTGARDPQPFLAEPAVVETDEDVTLYWTTEAMTQGAECPSNPWLPRAVQLKNPLGERPLLDGSTWPPARITVRDPYG